MYSATSIDYLPLRMECSAPGKLLALFSKPFATGLAKSSLLLLLITERIRDVEKSGIVSLEGL